MNGRLVFALLSLTISTIRLGIETVSNLDQMQTRI